MPPGGRARAPMEEPLALHPVKLYVYDLSKGMARRLSPLMLGKSTAGAPALPPSAKGPARASPSAVASGGSCPPTHLRSGRETAEITRCSPGRGLTRPGTAFSREWPSGEGIPWVWAAGTELRRRPVPEARLRSAWALLGGRLCGV